MAIFHEYKVVIYSMHETRKRWMISEKNNMKQAVRFFRVKMPENHTSLMFLRGEL